MLLSVLNFSSSLLIQIQTKRGDITSNRSFLFNHYCWMWYYPESTMVAIFESTIWSINVHKYISFACIYLCFWGNSEVTELCAFTSGTTHSEPAFSTSFIYWATFYLRTITANIVIIAEQILQFPTKSSSKCSRNIRERFKCLICFEVIKDRKSWWKGWTWVHCPWCSEMALAWRTTVIISRGWKVNNLSCLVLV